MNSETGFGKISVRSVRIRGHSQRLSRFRILKECEQMYVNVFAFLPVIKNGETLRWEYSRIFYSGFEEIWLCFAQVRSLVEIFFRVHVLNTFEKQSKMTDISFGKSDTTLSIGAKILFRDRIWRVLIEIFPNLVSEYFYLFWNESYNLFIYLWQPYPKVVTV